MVGSGSNIRPCGICCVIVTAAIGLRRRRTGTRLVVRFQSLRRDRNLRRRRRRRSLRRRKRSEIRT